MRSLQIAGTADHEVAATASFLVVVPFGANVKNRILIEETIMQRRNAFTLIELLVVIAIIAILAAILFPVFAQAREKARAVSCLSNGNQLGLGIMMYVQDYDETFPFWSYGQSSQYGNVSPNHFQSYWAFAIFPYVKSAGVYACPDTNNFATLASTNLYGWSSGNLINNGAPAALANSRVDYGGNQMLFEGDWQGFTPVTDAALKNPASTMAIADCFIGYTGYLPTSLEPDPTNANDPRHHYIVDQVAFPNAPANWWANNNAGAYMWYVGNYGPYTAAQMQIFDTQARHSEGDNITFADGHAKWMRDTNVNFDLLFGDQAN